MLSICKDGYDAPKRANPHLYSSPNWHAYAAGQWLAKNDYYPPIACKMSRGCNVRVTAQHWQSLTVTETILNIKDL